MIRSLTLLIALLALTLLSTHAERHTRQAAAAAAASSVLKAETPRQRYDPNWASLDTRQLPEWYEDAKFGIFIHFGVYSVPSWQPVGQYAEWYWERLVNKDDGGVTAEFHEQTYGPNFRYQDFAPMFKAELFNATEWADLFRRAGAKYTVPTSKHHEGFTLWPNRQSWNWNAVDIGPHRDLLGEIMNATRVAGIHAGLYFSLYEWFNPIYLNNVTEYVDEIMYPQWLDLINNYQPEVLWCDGEWEHNSTVWRSQEFLAYVFNDSPVRDTIVVDDRFGSDTNRLHGSFYTPEYDTSVYLNHKWETSLGIDIHSYGLNRATPADKYYTADYLIRYLVRTVANGGNMLLDIGPAADGTIPTIMQDRLLEIGAWLDVNGAAIYSSRKWRVQQEGSIDNTTVRYTTSRTGDVIYALLLTWPHSGVVNLPTPKCSASSTITMLGVGGSLQFKNLSTGGVSVQLPAFTIGQEPCQSIWTLALVNFS